MLPFFFYKHTLLLLLLRFGGKLSKNCNICNILKHLYWGEIIGAKYCFCTGVGSSQLCENSTFDFQFHDSSRKMECQDVSHGIKTELVTSRVADGQSEGTLLVCRMECKMSKRSRRHGGAQVLYAASMKWCKLRSTAAPSSVCRCGRQSWIPVRCVPALSLIGRHDFA